MKMTRKEFEEELNELGAPADELKSNGGRMPDHLKYGSWLRNRDPIAFNVAFNDWKRLEFYTTKKGELKNGNVRKRI